jgi:hypothetical protein
MKIPSFTTFAFIVLFFNGCNRQTEMNYAEFLSVKNIHFDEYNISVILGMPVDMVVLNDLVIILDAQTDRFFHVFSADRFNYLGNAIRRGRGPNEETEIYPYFRKYGNDKILYQSEDAVKIANIKLWNENLDIVVFDQFDLPESLLDGADYFKIKDYIFASFSQRPTSQDYTVLCTQTGELFEWGELIPLTGKNVKPDLIPSINQKLTTINSNDNLIASVFNILPILRIYSLENEKLIHELQMSDASNNREIIFAGQLLNSKEVINYYHRIKSTDELYLCTLWWIFSC